LKAGVGGREHIKFLTTDGFILFILPSESGSVVCLSSPLLLNLKLTNDGEKTFKKKSEEMMAKKTSQ